MRAGETLTATTDGIEDEDGLTGVEFAYQWVRSGTDIDGATSSTYTVTDDAGNEESVTSDAMAVAAALRLRSATLDGATLTLTYNDTLDDLGYLPQGAEESEVLFTLIAERYERRSLGITSNLVFSQWEHIFANPMATAAAIDRVVHHSVILEFDVPSYRTGVAQQRGQKKEVNRQE